MNIQMMAEMTLPVRSGTRPVSHDDGQHHAAKLRNEPNGDVPIPGKIKMYEFPRKPYLLQ
jgi:hypothetical protein